VEIEKYWSGRATFRSVATFAAFDDGNPAAHGGLALAEQCGLPVLVREKLHLQQAADVGRDQAASLSASESPSSMAP
jgi:hypothetical protein